MPSKRNEVTKPRRFLSATAPEPVPAVRAPKMNPSIGARYRLRASKPKLQPTPEKV